MGVFPPFGDASVYPLCHHSTWSIPGPSHAPTSDIPFQEFLRFLCLLCAAAVSCSIKQKKTGNVTCLCRGNNVKMKLLQTGNKRKQVAPDWKPFIARFGLEGPNSCTHPIPFHPSSGRGSRSRGWALSPQGAEWVWAPHPDSCWEDLIGRQG